MSNNKLIQLFVILFVIPTILSCVFYISTSLVHGNFWEGQYFIRTYIFAILYVIGRISFNYARRDK